jgi:hypothetical protein
VRALQVCGMQEGCAPQNSMLCDIHADSLQLMTKVGVGFGRGCHVQPATAAYRS